MTSPAKSNLDSENGSHLACELCGKSHERRDLLMRHRRRCHGPRKQISRRKACDECVQAKAKCDYLQPACSRCTKRRTPCVYAAFSVISTRHRPEQRSQASTADSPQSNIQLSFAQNGNLETMTEPFDMGLPDWDSSDSPFSIDTFNMTLADLANTTVTLPEITAAQPAPLLARTDFTSSSQLLGQDPLSFSSTAWGITTPTSITRVLGETMSTTTDPTPSLTSTACARLLAEYPSFLMRDDSTSPFLHHALYIDVVPDITVLPLTSMAILCGSGMNIVERCRFSRRVMDAERQRLIGQFPNYQCMEQWDALHATLIYEDLELRETISEDSESWKQNPYVKGLRSPFLLKMTQCYSKNYRELRNPDIKVFSDPQSVLTSSSSDWARWMKTESARRMIFLANMLNFYSNRDYSTGQQLAYYEALNDELILNMPLPCSQAAWLARNEHDWRAAMQNLPSVAESHGSSGFNGPEDGAQAFLKTILSEFSKDDIQIESGKRAGFGESDELRNLIILCASEQFT